MKAVKGITGFRRRSTTQMEVPLPTRTVYNPLIAACNRDGVGLRRVTPRRLFKNALADMLIEAGTKITADDFVIKSCLLAGHELVWVKIEGVSDRGFCGTHCMYFKLPPDALESFGMVPTHELLSPDELDWVFMTEHYQEA